jgi:sec-independent protein translocase protein TatA
MFGFSIGHLMILLFVLLLFNAKKLPELGSALGRGMSAFKKGLEGKNRDGSDPSLPKDPDDPDEKNS